MNDDGPPDSTVDRLCDESVTVQEAAGCTTWNGSPAMVRVPTRSVASALGAASKVTLAEPEPVAPAVMVSQGAAEEAVQEQPLAARTLAPPAPPLAGSEAEEDRSEKEQTVPL